MIYPSPVFVDQGEPTRIRIVEGSCGAIVVSTYLLNRYVTKLIHTLSQIMDCQKTGTDGKAQSAAYFAECFMPLPGDNPKITE